jgi:hypothetical protein
MAKVDVKIIRYDEANQNIEGIKGSYGQLGEKQAAFTVIKNLLFVNLHKGAKYTDAKLPSVYDGFIQLSNGQRIIVTDSTLNCNLPSNVTGFGVLVLSKWN